MGDRGDMGDVDVDGGRDDYIFYIVSYILFFI